MNSKQSLIYYVLLVVGVIVLINILAVRVFFRLDLTEDKKYTLSDATKNILLNLEDPVTISAYYPKDKNLPPDYARIKRELKDILNEYANISKGMLVYEFKDPLDDEKVEREAVEAGIMEVMINVREKDQVKAQKAYMGLVIHLNEDSEVIPVIESDIGLEHMISTHIKKLSVTDKPAIGILQGHGEPDITQLQQVKFELDVLYQVETVYLNDTIDKLQSYNTLVIIAPKDSIPPSQLMQLNNFLSRGGRILVAINRVGADESQQFGQAINTNLETWLQSKGIDVHNNYIIDVQCPMVQLTQQMGNYRTIIPVQFYFYPVITEFSEHPITSGLEQVILQFASSMSFSGDSSVVYTPIASTSEKSGTRNAYSIYQVQEEWTETDFPLSELTVAATLEGKIEGNSNSKMVVFSDGDFPLGDPRGGQLNPDNVSLLVNAIDWLSDDTGLIELRTKGATSRPIKELEDGKRTFLKYLNFLLPILLIIIYGMIRMQRKQILRLKRMEEGYV